MFAIKTAKSITTIYITSICLGTTATFQRITNTNKNTPHIRFFENVYQFGSWWMQKGWILYIAIRGVTDCVDPFQPFRWRNPIRQSHRNAHRAGWKSATQILSLPKRTSGASRPIFALCLNAKVPSPMMMIIIMRAAPHPPLEKIHRSRRIHTTKTTKQHPNWGFFRMSEGQEAPEWRD